MGVFNNVSYKEFADRFVVLDKALKLDNPNNLNINQAINMHKAFGLTYLNLTDDLTKLQEINAPQIMEMANKRILDFEAMLLNVGES